jgi:hypothetical protein
MDQIGSTDEEIGYAKKEEIAVLKTIARVPRQYEHADAYDHAENLSETMKEGIAEGAGQIERDYSYSQNQKVAH